MPNSGPERDQTIGSTDWNDPVSIGKAAARLWFHRDWSDDAQREAYRNIEFVTGKQWRNQWNPRTRTMENEEGRARWDVRLSYNLVLSQIKQRLSKLIRQNVVPDVIPETEDEGDREIARMSTQLMTHVWREVLRAPQMIRDALAMIVSGELRPVEPVSYPFEDAARALADQQQRRVVGKAVLVP